MSIAAETLLEYQPQAERPKPMSAFIVTVKVMESRGHDPRAKQTGICPVSGKVCTDVTGAHHSFMVVGATAQAVRNQVTELGYGHITRIEEV